MFFGRLRESIYYDQHASTLLTPQTTKKSATW